MSTTPVPDPSRRRFIQGSTALLIGVYLAPKTGRAAQRVAQPAAAAQTELAPNAFVRISESGDVTVIAKHLEMGQGVYTGLATLAAEELDADWSRVRVVAAPADRELYSNLSLGALKLQTTGGSSSMFNSWEQMRQAGAAARAMLLAEAAQRWKVPASEITIERGVLIHRSSGHRGGFGEFVAGASRRPVPTSIALKKRADYRLIGKEGFARTDIVEKTHGKAIYIQDLRLPGMLVAVVAHAPRFGGTVKHVDDREAMKIPGVVAVVSYPGTKRSLGGVAVLARNTWVARKGRDALKIDWDLDRAERVDTVNLTEQYKKIALTPGDIVAQVGDVTRASSGDGTVIEAFYELPYLAHAAMEPMNCIVQVGDGECTVWNGEQWQTPDQLNLGEQLGIPPEKVTLNQLYAGGSFGRRASPVSDYLCEAASIATAAKQRGITGPVKMVWMREDDMRAGGYRPLVVHWARAYLDRERRLQSMHHRIVAQDFLGSAGFSFFNPKKIQTMIQGLSDMPYTIPNLQVEQHPIFNGGVSVQWYRSVEHTHTAFAGECFLDELAIVSGTDPLKFRLDRLTTPEAAPYRTVLTTAAKAAGWDKPLAPGAPGEKRGRGIAVQSAFRTFVAHIAEVTVATDGTFRVDRLVVAIDCGVAINPSIIRAQMEGGAGFGLSYTLHGAITLKDGQVQQSNFHDYPVLRISEMPTVEVHIVESDRPPTGVGEPGVCTVAPAVANAIAAATGIRLRSLPLPARLTT
ncbi:xanthine dehydrogenase family protein molybdopterin-binding subunit [Paraburkholderia sp. LEh10]|uniref:xanthine dehydrogenase family protein molybdopterin-binding subunit n=1 Tax=Paraburkholderia sp. LEh10 TaxID=2821353 RepID=UPI001AE1AE71|nr:xanthine dehydrogenase family protein molybdopterin-binding subunit [Paraburkholderia sp. LEh10]MBP0590414.1 xanthine dehydrogenase family protein molybdopterin-binding subunit [Paraburkholderia sp. LEh10]